MELKQLTALSGLLFATINLYAAPPHFYIQMENLSDKAAAISFKQEVGNVFLEPGLADKTPLDAHTSSAQYDVHIEPLDPKATFDVVFTGKKDCTFNIGFYAPANPKVIVSGEGCYGGGYQITNEGTTLLLYISDIHKKV